MSQTREREGRGGGGKSVLPPPRVQHGNWWASINAHAWCVRATLLVSGLCLAAIPDHLPAQARSTRYSPLADVPDTGTGKGVERSAKRAGDAGLVNSRSQVMPPFEEEGDAMPCEDERKNAVEWQRSGIGQRDA